MLLTRLIVGLCCLSFAAFAQKQADAPKLLDPVQGDGEGRKLVAEILAQQPEQTFTNGLLKIRDREGNERKLPVRFQTLLTPTNWSSIYDVSPSPPSLQGAPGIVRLTIIHTDAQPNQYLVNDPAGTNPVAKAIPPENTMIPFAGSDFWLADLGFEFLHWPRQRVIKKEMYSSQSCAVLDSINPSPDKSGYARVRSWLTIESPHLPVRAEAYDSSDKRLKVFDVKSIEKVNGHFQVDAVEMRNSQTGSRSVLEFDLGNE